MLAALGFSTPAVKSGGAGGEPEPSASELVALEVSGSHMLTVNGYSKTKGVVFGHFITAATFAAAGHRWSILYNPNGTSYDDSDYIALYLKVEPSSGPDVVNARFRFSLLNVNGEPVRGYSKSSDEASWRKFMATMIKKRGFPRFISRTALEHSGCLIDDCFSIRCDITVLKVIHKDKGVAAERFFIVPPSNMDQDFRHLLSSGKGADISFDVAGEIFVAHRNILAARSPVFMAEFFSPMKEKAAACVRLDDMEARVFEALLHYVYTDALPEIDQGETMVMAQHLLVAADRYSLVRLKLICEDKLCNYIDTSTVGTILTLSEQHGCHGLKKACFQFLMSGNNLNAAIGTDGFDHLTNSCPSVLKELLAKVTI
ncbi:BTB/POZ and MATH domain-containing protein 1 [Dichanthelium oligosanthes]|uniref:BTB/POZ and MATH domain-containing protein 1 n=1 Tax=Dichanthelium oligosanthes TaxID=888268 RepID=A0A1E5UMM9_9POAL|nr:BTB/POZ and MATH domain-containing protein 1 [Dichanthelium oligosanthes]